MSATLPVVESEPADQQSDGQGLVRLKLSITLYEDLHIGTGLGGGEGGDIDSTQCLDAAGNPTIPWTHLKGVLRNTAERMAEQKLLQGDEVIKLFGWNSRSKEGDVLPQQGDAVIGTGFLKSCPDGKKLIRWTSAARKKNSRKPLEDTKRTVEFIAAGCVFEVLCELPGSLALAFRKVAEATARLGADRSRGSGLVNIKVEVWSGDADSAASAVQRTGLWLRLLLRNMEPLCFPTTPMAGNIIDSSSHIPGSTLFGAIAAALHRTGNVDTQTVAAAMLAERKVCVGNAYPLPSGVDAARILSTITVLPAPLSYRAGKPEAKDITFPHWAGDASPVKWLFDGTRDSLNEAMKPLPESKRLSDDAFIMQTAPGTAWRQYSAKLAHRMRINVPDTGKQDEQELFTSEEIPENTRFVADIRFNDEKAAVDFNKAAALVLTGRSRLRLGRGGRPVEVLACAWPETAEEFKLPDGCEELRLVLESDCILRGPNLGFITRLDRTGLLALKPGLEDTVSQIDIEPMDDVITVRGFNASSGLPRVPALALRRGSVVRLTIKKEIAAGATAAGREALQKVAVALGTGSAWGERTHEGYGRVRLFTADEPLAASVLAQSVSQHSPSSTDGLKPDPAEPLAMEAERFAISDSGTKFSALKNAKLRKTALQSIVTIAKGAPPEKFKERLEKQLKHLFKRINKNSDQEDLSERQTAGILEALGLNHQNPTKDTLIRAQKLMHLVCRWRIASGEHNKRDPTRQDAS